MKGRTLITSEDAAKLIVAHAKEHGRPGGQVFEDAALSGIAVPGGRLMMMGARWYRVESSAVVRRFEVVLPPPVTVVPAGTKPTFVLLDASAALHTVPAGFRPPKPVRRTVEVPTRAQLAVNLCELGYGSVEAGLHAIHAWKTGLAKAGAQVVVGEIK